MKVDWLWTKSINKRSKRQGGVIYPLVMPPPASFTALMIGDENECPFTADASLITRKLKAIGTTSLVFRRALEHRAAALGMTEEQRAALLTHQSTSMVRAHYSYVGAASSKKEPAKKRSRSA